MAADKDATVGSVAAPMGYYRHPDHSGDTVHECGYTLHEHGWIDSFHVGGEDGITVCPAPTGPFQGQTVSERGRQPRQHDGIAGMLRDAGVEERIQQALEDRDYDDAHHPRDVDYDGHAG